eukprot:TRINITY_DN7103_c0_g1_i1.p2 TRINITY_DN7103_c0_g1~~TRINITY_DN7103_c0_g1_i1.p2  ORF type:complete len:123 (+),score=22.37 TRINITY_DN7103_c0_g1_i1:383-751(+)
MFLKPFFRMLYGILDRIFTNFAVRHIRTMQHRSTEKLIYNNGVKFFVDDSYLTLTMRMGNPGYTDHGHKGLWYTPPDHLVEDMYPFWKAGCRIHVHSNGDAANDLLSRAFGRSSETAKAHRG